MKALSSDTFPFALTRYAFATMIHCYPDKPTLRPMRPDDLTTVMEIQAACYGREMLEPVDILHQRLRCSDDTCWVALHGNEVLAYLTAYRSRLGDVTPLHGQFNPASPADTLYLHDLAVHPCATGRKLGQTLVGNLLDMAQHEKLHYSALVSVQDSYLFWSQQGYEDHPLSDEIQRGRLASYGDSPRYMSRKLRSHAI